MGKTNFLNVLFNRDCHLFKHTSQCCKANHDTEETLRGQKPTVLG
jgi:hypothetical protein